MSLGKKKMLHQAAGGVVNTENFNTVTYQGNNSTNPRTNVGFQPDLVWIKNRDNANDHFLTDSVRGAGEYLVSNSAAVEDTTNRFNSFDSNGFTVSTDTALLNNSSYNYVAWCWKAGGAAVSNTDGSITSSVSANPDAGFSIVSYTGNGAIGQTVGHGLTSSPEFIIVKSRNTVGTTDPSWIGYHKDLTADYKILLNQSSASGTSGNWGNTNPTNSVFYVLSGDSGTNANGGDFIAYCFHSVDGYQKVGSYTSLTGSSVQVYTDSNGDGTGTGAFEPRFVMIKLAVGGASAYTGWAMFDSLRDPNTTNDNPLYANKSQQEGLRGIGSGSAANSVDIQFNSSGFLVDPSSNNDGETNEGAGSTYIYLAIA